MATRGKLLPSERHSGPTATVLRLLAQAGLDTGRCGPLIRAQCPR